VTDDEAFIRAVVDGPGDDTPRLVYADWLDDRADPRGTYLRAEHAWARTGRGAKKLAAPAAGLDPVWVARVSRPPHGVCADKIVMRTDRPPLAPADLDAAEARLGVALPAEHRALLLNWNGARPSIGLPAPTPRLRFYHTAVEEFVHVTPAGGPRRGVWDLVHAASAILNPDYLFRHGRTENPMADFLPLADSGEGDFYMIGARGRVTGRVAFFHDFTHNAGDPDHLSVAWPSLGRLLASITDHAPEWYRLIKNGDKAGLFAWLDAGGDVNALDAERDETPLTLAMVAEDLPLVQELLARGAKVDRRAREMAGMLSGASGRKIRNAVLGAKRPKKSAARRGKKP
jgi:uncharacterized protein (TIGR02996 family)